MESQKVIVYATGPEQFEGLHMSILSLMRCATFTCLMSVSINVFVDVKHSTQLRHFLPTKILQNVFIYQLDTSALGNFSFHASREKVGMLDASENFIRFFLPMYFPQLPQVLYLDADTIVRRSVCDLFYYYSSPLEGAGLAAAPRRSSCMVQRVPSEYRAQWVQQPTLTFNAGVFLADLKFWKRYRISEKALSLLRRNEKENLWLTASNPPLCIVFANAFVKLNWRWHVYGLGFKSKISNRTLNEAYILHWNGIRKPWLPTGMWKMYWRAD